jgi:TolA-binding protein
LDAAIAQAENYLRLEPKGDFAENAYYLMADSYLAQKKAYSAVSTLNKLLNLKLPDTDDQYLYYRLGYAYEQSEKIVDAVAAYRQVMKWISIPKQPI